MITAHSNIIFIVTTPHYITHQIIMITAHSNIIFIITATHINIFFIVKTSYHHTHTYIHFILTTFCIITIFLRRTSQHHNTTTLFLFYNNKYYITMGYNYFLLNSGTTVPQQHQHTTQQNDNTTLAPPYNATTLPYGNISVCPHNTTWHDVFLSLFPTTITTATTYNFCSQHNTTASFFSPSQQHIISPLRNTLPVWEIVWFSFVAVDSVKEWILI